MISIKMLNKMRENAQCNELRNKRKDVIKAQTQLLTHMSTELVENAQNNQRLPLKLDLSPFFGCDPDHPNIYWLAEKLREKGFTVKVEVIWPKRYQRRNCYDLDDLLNAFKNWIARNSDKNYIFTSHEIIFHINYPDQNGWITLKDK